MLITLERKQKARVVVAGNRKDAGRRLALAAEDSNVTITPQGKKSKNENIWELLGSRIKMSSHCIDSLQKGAG